MVWGWARKVFEDGFKGLDFKLILDMRGFV